MSIVPEAIAVGVTVNGRDVTLEVEPRTSLADAIRSQLDLTGTHLGCEHGVCGACTILLDDEPARACLMLAVQADGRRVTTIEGLAVGDERHPVQRAMYEAMSFQCAFCSPGFMMSAVALLTENPTPTREEIREELSGNLCRCTGDHSIVDGVERAAALLQAGTATDGAS